MRTQLPKLTDRLPLGASGLAVSPVCIGITAPEVVPAAYEAGINFFFVTADMHWPIYDGTRRGLAELLAAKPAARDDLVVAVVAYVTQPEFCSVPFEEVLEAVPGLARIDVAVAGGAYGHELARRLPVYERHRAVGFAGARAIGASFHDRLAARDTVAAGTLDVAFVRYSPTYPGARDDLFPHVGPHPRSLLFNFKSTHGMIRKEEEYAAFGIGDDFWRPHPTDYYRFALTEPALDGILCAPPDAVAIGELADALARGPLDADDHQYLLDLGELVRGTARVKGT